jgi:hypothetical protein
MKLPRRQFLHLAGGDTGPDRGKAGEVHQHERDGGRIDHVVVFAVAHGVVASSSSSSAMKARSSQRWTMGRRKVGAGLFTSFVTHPQPSSKSTLLRPLTSSHQWREAGVPRWRDRRQYPFRVARPTESLLPRANRAASGEAFSFGSIRLSSSKPFASSLG